MPATHFLSGPYHYRFDNSLPPALTIEPGDTVVFDCRDATDGQITPDSVAADLLQVDRGRAHSLAGPVAIAGAQPGDVLQVEVLDLAHYGWGWTAVRPGGLGLLSEDFADTLALYIWRVDSSGRLALRPDIRVPVEPFCGVMGVAPAEPGAHLTLAPRITGGNLDIRHLCRGSTLYLPVEVPGALFSVGDGHLAQGDGEVCLTAVEAPLRVTLRLDLRRGRPIPAPQFVTPAAAVSKVAGMGYFATTAIGPDLYRNAQDAVRYMIDHLVEEYGLTRVEAYMLCSVAGDLKISQIVDRPNWLVSFHMPESIFLE